MNNLSHKKNYQKNQKILYISDLKSVEKIRKKLSRHRFIYQIEASKLISVSFKVEQIKPQNFQIFSSLINLLSFSSELEEFSLSVFSYKIERKQFIELLIRIFSLNIRKSFQFSAPNLSFTKEIMGYFTKFLITSYRHLTVLDLDFTLNKFGDDGIGIFGLGIVNFKVLQSLKLNFNHCKMKGMGLTTLLTNMKALKQLINLELNCQGINRLSQNFQETYLVFLKLMKSLTSLKMIKLDFSDNYLGPECILKTILLFLKNSYFDNIQKISLDLKKNCTSRLWETFESLNLPLLSKKKYDKYLESFELNLKANSIGDSNFRHFYDVLIHFKGMKDVILNLSDNKLKQFRSNLFFIFGSIGHNLSLESFEMDVTGSQSILFQNFSINGDHLPNLESLHSLILKSNLPKIMKIERVFSNFLRKFQNLKKCQIFIPQTDKLEAEGIIFLFDSITLMKKLKTLNIEFSCNHFGEEDYSKIIDKLKILENLENLRMALRTDYSSPLRENFVKLLSIRSFCKKLMNLDLVARKEDHQDQKFKRDLKFVGSCFLKENIFLKVEEFEDISSIFSKKKSFFLVAYVLKKQLKLFFKRNLIISEILEFYI